MLQLPGHNAALLIHCNHLFCGDVLTCRTGRPACRGRVHLEPGRCSAARRNAPALPAPDGGNRPRHGAHTRAHGLLMESVIASCLGRPPPRCKATHEHPRMYPSPSPGAKPPDAPPPLGPAATRHWADPARAGRGIGRRLHLPSRCLRRSRPSLRGRRRPFAARRRGEPSLAAAARTAHNHTQHVHTHLHT